MAVTRVQVSGLKELGEAMRELSSDVALKVARSATAAAATLVKKAAQGHIQKNSSKSGDAIDKGNLLAAVITKRLGKNETDLTSEHIVTVRGRGKKSKKTGIVSSYAPHAHFVELGTVNMPAEPFLRPAIDQNQTQAVQAMAKKLADRIAKVKPK